MAVFTLTPAQNNFTGTPGENNRFDFTTADLQATDTIAGGAKNDAHDREPDRTHDSGA